MAVIQDGVNASLIAKVNANLSIATQLVPTPGGQYSAGWETTSLAFTNNVVVWDFHNPNANLVLVTGLTANVVQMAVAALAGTGLRWGLQLFVGRSYTTVSPTNRSALTLTTNNCKMRTSYATPVVAIGFSNNVAGITGGVITEDATALATKSGSAQDIVAAANANQQTRNDDGLCWSPNPFQGPIVLAQNEGVRLRYLVTTAAAVIITGQVQWSELGTTIYP